MRCLPRGLHGARLRQEEEKKKKKGRTVIGPQSIKEKGEGGVSENDVMGVAVRPRPVGNRRQRLLVEVCGREGWGTEEGVWLLSRPLLPNKTVSSRQHSGRTDGWMGRACSGDGWRARRNTNRPFE